MTDFIEPFEVRDRTTDELLSLVARKLVTGAPDTAQLSRMTTQEMAERLGIDRRSARAVQAALAISSRSPALSRSLPISNSEAIARYFRERLGTHRKESFWALTLDQKHRPIDCHRISEGTLTMCPVHPREAFLPALRDSAAAVVFVHNHTSGNPEPSVDDRLLTKRLVACGTLLGIRILDHLVVGSHGHYSFLDHEALKDKGETRVSKTDREIPKARPFAAMEKPPEQIRDRFRDDGRGR